MTGLDALARDYRVAFLGYLTRRREAALHRGYELGRAAVAQGVSILDVARVHHEVLLDVLRETPTEDFPAVAGAASEFLLEVLATFDMAQRAFLPGPVETADARTPRPRGGVAAPRPGAR